MGVDRASWGVCHDFYVLQRFFFLLLEDGSQRFRFHHRAILDELFVTLISYMPEAIPVCKCTGTASRTVLSVCRTEPGYAIAVRNDHALCANKGHVSSARKQNNLSQKTTCRKKAKCALYAESDVG